jgi:hypothetical protein
MTDERSFIDRTQARSVLRNGRELALDEMASQLALCDDDARVAALEEFEASDMPLGERLAYARVLYGTHERLRKAGR